MATSQDTIINIPDEHHSSSIDEKKTIVTETVTAVDSRDGPISHRPKLTGRRTTGLRTASSDKSNNRQIGADGEEDSITQLGKLYTAILNFSVLTRYAVFIIPVAALLAVPVIVTATAAKDTFIGKAPKDPGAHNEQVRLLGLFVWIEVVWFGLWAAKLIAMCLPPIFQGFCGIISAGTRKYMLLIKALEIPLSLLIWTIICYGTAPVIQLERFQPRHRQPNAGWVQTLQRVFLASIAVSACFVAEKVIVQLVGINYHRKQFSAKIQASKRRVRMLDVLYEASRKLFPAYCPEFVDEDYVILTGVDNKDNSQAKLVGGIGMIGENFTSAFGNMASEITGQQISTTAAHSIVVESLEMKTSTEALARRIWTSFVEQGNDALYCKDIIDILGEGSSAEAEEIFDMLDVDHNGDISLEEMVATVVEIARERKDMARSMHDVGQAVRILDRFLICVVLVLIAIIYGKSDNLCAILTTNMVQRRFSAAVSPSTLRRSVLRLLPCRSLLPVLSKNSSAPACSSLSNTLTMLVIEL